MNHLTLTALRALDHHGGPEQMLQAAEECAELIAALSHYRRGKADAAAVLSELADVTIMVEQLSHAFGREDYEAALKAKLDRLADTLPPVETVSAFRARMEEQRANHSQIRAGQVAWYAMTEECGGSAAQDAFAANARRSNVDPFFFNDRIPAFIAAAVKAGVLREDAP